MSDELNRETLRALVTQSSPEGLNEFLGGLTDAECDELVYDWGLWARPTEKREDGTFTGQCAPPGEWETWLLLTGRGYGKTRSAAEWVRDEVRAGKGRRWAFVAPDPADARDTMIEGESGILAVSPPSERPIYSPSRRLLTWPNGAVAHIFSASDPEDLRGPEHDRAWLEELCSWNKLEETWSNFDFGFRLPAPDGSDPKCVITTTPKPVNLLREIMKDPGTVMTTGSTYENLSNLATKFAKRVIRRYEGTRLGEQELHGVFLEEAEGALWQRELIQANRIKPADFDLDSLLQVVVGVDPAGSTTKKTSETGIVVGGIDRHRHFFTIADLSGRLSPNEWGRRAVKAFDKYGASCIVGEGNYGGDMVTSVIKTASEQLGIEVKIKKVRARSGKRSRAEPIAALMEQGREHHVGYFGDMESQMCTFTGSLNDVSPDRMDAKVWALTELLGARTFRDTRPVLSTRVGNPYNEI